MSIESLCNILDEQSPETAEEFVLVLGQVRGNGLLEPIRRRKRMLAADIDSARTAMAAIYGGRIAKLQGPYDSESCAGYDPDAMIRKIDPGERLPTSGRDVLKSILWRAPEEQLALLEFVERGIPLCSTDPTAIEQLAEHAGDRYLPKVHKCIELTHAGTTIRDSTITLTYNERAGTPELQEVFTRPFVRIKLDQERGSYDDRLQRCASAISLELSLAEFKTAFLFSHPPPSLEEFLRRFMDTNPHRAPLPNQRALRFICGIDWYRDVNINYPKKYNYRNVLEIGIDGKLGLRREYRV